MKLNVQTFGDAKNQAVILIHPFPFDHNLWNDVAQSLGNEGYFVVAPDLRGCGSSELGPAEPNLDLLASDVFELISDLKITNPIVGGISLGGYVAMAMLRQEPNALSGLILLDTKASADGQVAKENRLKVANQMKEHGKVGLFAEQMIVNVVGEFTHANRRQVIDQVKQWMNESSAQTIAWLQQAMANRPDSFSDLAKFSKPVLLIRGSEDAISSADDFSQMKSAIGSEVLEITKGQVPSNQVTFVELPNAGHLPPVEDPAQTAKVISSWLAEVTSVDR